jgi:hypothetical protein
MANENMFDGIEGARVSEGGVYFKPGAFRARILAVKALKDRKQVGTFVVECELLESSEPSLPRGTVCSWVVKLDKEPALGNIKAFAAAATGVQPKEVTAKAIELIVSEGNPLKDVTMKVSASNIKTKSGSDFTKVTWQADEDQDEATA